MDSIEIGLWVTGGMLVLVVLGMRVAFAAATAGLLGPIWLRWDQYGYDPGRLGQAIEVSFKIAGQVPHGKVASQAPSLIPTFILIGYLAYYAGLTRALFEAANRWIAWVPGGGWRSRPSSPRRASPRSRARSSRRRRSLPASASALPRCRRHCPSWRWS